MGGRCCLQVLLAVREDIQLFQPQASLQTLRCAVLRPLLRQAVAVGHTSVRSAEALLAYQRSFSHSGYAWSHISQGLRWMLQLFTVRVWELGQVKEGLGACSRGGESGDIITVSSATMSMGSVLILFFLLFLFISERREKQKRKKLQQPPRPSRLLLWHPSLCLDR